MKKTLLILATLVIVGGIFIYNLTKERDITYNYFNFDTSIEIKVYYQNKDFIDTEQIDTDLQNLLDEIETTFSRTLEGSELYQLNQEKTLEVSDEFIEVLNQANEFCNDVDGSYDYSSGKLIELWSINNADYLPTQDEIDALIGDINCNDVKVEGNQVSIPENVDLDFGSIVKGYAADEIDAYLREAGVESALINLGGNIQTIGNKPDGSDYKIGIQTPEIENTTNENCAVIDASDKAVVTSGINQRFFVEDGKIYHHILNAENGYPVDNNLASVTIVTDQGIIADGLSTTAFILGLEEGMEYINSIDGVEAFFIKRFKKINKKN